MSLPVPISEPLTRDVKITSQAWILFLESLRTNPAAITPTISPAIPFRAGVGGVSKDTSTWGGYTIGQIVAALKQVGVLE